MKRLNTPTKAETIRKHLRQCLNGDAQNVALMPGNGRPVNNADFADAVRREAHRLLAEGKMNVRAEHGLQAQALIDRRAEKDADRKLVVEMGRLLSGYRSDPAEIVVGEWKEVGGDETENADADGGALAPLALVVGE